MRFAVAFGEGDRFAAGLLPPKSSRSSMTMSVSFAPELSGEKTPAPILAAPFGAGFGASFLSRLLPLGFPGSSSLPPGGVRLRPENSPAPPGVTLRLGDESSSFPPGGVLDLGRFGTGSRLDADGLPKPAEASRIAAKSSSLTSRIARSARGKLPDASVSAPGSSSANG